MKRKSLGWGLSCRFVRGLMIGLLALGRTPIPALAQTCPIPSVPVQVEYKVSAARHNKCGFGELMQDDPPRVHIYHQQVTSLSESYSFDNSGSSSACTNYSWEFEGTEVEVGVSDGSFSNDKLFTYGVTNNQTILGIDCDYTNVFTGGSSLVVSQSDSRVWFYSSSGEPCPFSDTRTNFTDNYTDTMSILYSNGWYFVTTHDGEGYTSDSRFCDSPDCEPGYDMMTYRTDFPSTSMVPAGIPSFSYIATSRTHGEADLSSTNALDVCDSASYVDTKHGTVDLYNEYTDDELRGYILGLMPAFPSTWYDPTGGPGDDPTLMMAYSAIDATHTQGSDFWCQIPDYSNAELQKMRYRISLIDPDPSLMYQITWDELTIDWPAGTTQTQSKSATISGGDGHTAEYDVDAPPWDTGTDPTGGTIFTIVSNVRASVIQPSFKQAVLPGLGPLPSGGGVGGSGCATCGGSTSAYDPRWGGFSAAFTLGPTPSSSSAGSLRIFSQGPSLELATPAGLICDTNALDVETIMSGGAVRQVLAAQALADVVTLDDFSYEIRYYTAAQAGSKVGGVYEPSGSPFVIWKVENPDASTSTFNRVRITETRGSDSREYDYTYTAAGNDWKLDYPGGLREDEWTVTNVVSSDTIVFGGATNAYHAWNIYPYTRTVTGTVRVPGGPVQYQTKRVYQLFSWGEGLTEEDIGTGSTALTTTYSNIVVGMTMPFGSLPPLDGIKRSDGSWEYYPDGYDTNGALKTVLTSLDDAGYADVENAGGKENFFVGQNVDIYETWDPTDNTNIHRSVPRMVWEIKYGNVMGRKFTSFPSADVRIDSQTTDISVEDWNDASNLFTTNRYYTNGPFQGMLKSIVLPDRTLQTFAYTNDATGFYRTNFTGIGQADSTFTHVVDGITNITVVNLPGYTIASSTWDATTGILIAQDTYGSFDDFGRPQTVSHLDGTSESTSYSCCGIQSTTDRDGVTTSYTYDAMKRLVATTRLGITTSNVLDSAGRTIATIRIGSSGTAITQQQFQYDTAGRMIGETNALGGPTSIVETTDPTTKGRILTTTYADGGTRIEAHYRDGSLKSMTGTAVHQVRYAHGYDGDEGVIYSKEIKLSDGSDTSEWTKDLVDAAGRTYKTVYADSTYTRSWFNNQGQMWKQQDADGDITLHTFNGNGEQDYSITALSDTARGFTAYGDLVSGLSGILSGTDYVSEAVSDVVYDSSHSANVRRTQSYVWATGGSSSPSLLSVSESSVDGLQSWNTSYAGLTAQTFHSQTVYGSGGARTVTATAPDNSYTVSTYQNGQLTNVVQKDSSGGTIRGTGYAYDEFGQQTSVNDLRNGATSYTYNAADQVATVTTPVPASGQSAQTTTTYYNKMLQATNVVQPDNTSVFSEYWQTGELKRQYGSRTYPVGYGYDYAGRMQTMTNWTTFSTGAGVRVTMWNYNEYRGWLSSKADANGNGPTYTYTPDGRLYTRMWARTMDGGGALVTTYSYDNAGALADVSYSDSTPEVTYHYDRLGHQSSIVCNGMTTTKAYTLGGLPLSESNSSGTLGGLSVTNGYDQFLRRTNLVALNSGTPLTWQSFGYDNASRLNLVTDNTGSTAYSAAYTYIADSPLVSQIVFEENSTTRMTTTKTYDDLNRLASISSVPSSGSTVSFGYAYSAANQRTAVTNSDGSLWLYQYDSLGQVTSGKKYWSDGTPVAGQQFGYTFDDIGNRTQTQAGGDQNGANLRTASYSANNLNEYTSRTVPGGVDIIGTATNRATVTVNDQRAYRKGNYFWDQLALNNSSSAVWAGLTNRAVLNNGSSSDIMATNFGDVFLPQTPESFGYDLDGNLLWDGRWNYVWDAENRIIAMSPHTNIGPQISLKFEYDCQGRRIRKQVWNTPDWTGTASTDLKFAYDGWNLCVTLSSGSLQSFYVWGLDLSGSMRRAGGVGGLIEAVLGGSSTTNCFIASDGNGNIAELANAANGAAMANYEYSPFGEIIRATGSLAKANPFRFSTKYQDDETDLVYYGYRFLNVSLGCWSSPDPVIESGFNILRHAESRRNGRIPPLHGVENERAFVRNSGVNLVDYVGLKTITFKVAGDSSGVIFDVYNLGGMDGEVQTVKDVLSKCNCSETVNVNINWDWTLYAGPSTSQWNLSLSGNGPDDPVLVSDWGKMGSFPQIPVILTGYDLSVDGSTFIAGYTRQAVGTLLNAGTYWRDFYVVHTILAHELGHFAGYDGGDLDNKHHSSDKNNIMYKPGDRGTTPDSTYCKKVSLLAH